MKAAILGATGYTGMLLTRLLATHPQVETILPVSSSRAGKPIRDADGGFADDGKLTRREYLSIEETVSLGADVVFAALPHLTSAQVCAPFMDSSVVIDLSADFRISDRALFEEAYGAARPESGQAPVYGLSELYRKEIATADLIANPGCYPTTTLLPLLPLLAEGNVNGPVIINAISGISGAGKKAKENLLFCERSENAGAYSPGTTHRHWAEMTDQLRQNGKGNELYFTPHLAPLRRGMSVTTVLQTDGNTDQASIVALLEERYRNMPFIRILTSTLPQTRDVWGTNRCDIGVHTEGTRVFLFSCIDNLMKGASGQAVQNMNIRFGFPEAAGLPLSGMV